MDEIEQFLTLSRSLLTMDLFTRETDYRISISDGEMNCFYFDRDISKGTENQPIAVVNTVDNDRPQNTYVYSPRRSAAPGVPLNLDPNFLACCDCTDNCKNSLTCSCQKLTSENLDVAPKFKKALKSRSYVHKSLLNCISTGIFECNSNCKCKASCNNRVVQGGTKVRLQLFKTLKKGWGVRTLDDIPKGSFVTTYAAQILNETIANVMAETSGDDFLANLDCIEVCEGLKFGYEAEAADYSDTEDVDNFNEDDVSESDDDDHDYGESVPGESDVATFSQCDIIDQEVEETTGLRRSKRRRVVRKTVGNPCESGEEDEEDDSDGQISDDETSHETCYLPIRAYYREDSVYVLDANFEGNIGRYFNHSCDPNLFVQNVFIDTHDLRFPEVSFFAHKNIKAYQELTWNYRYEVGSVEGKNIECHCDAANCKKRLL